MQLVTFFIAAFCQLFATQKALSLTRMAISKKLKTRSWLFFRAVYNRLLERWTTDSEFASSRSILTSTQSSTDRLEADFLTEVLFGITD